MTVIRATIPHVMILKKCENIIMERDKMTEYLVFPTPPGLAKVEASNVNAARNKYRKAMPEMEEDELIIVPSSFAQKTSIDIILPMWKCNFEAIK